MVFAYLQRLFRFFALRNVDGGSLHHGHTVGSISDDHRIEQDPNRRTILLPQLHLPAEERTFPPQITQKWFPVGRVE